MVEDRAIVTTERSLPCDTMHSADYAVARCLSVYPSVTHRYYDKMAKYILKRFSASGSHTILVFLNQTLWQYSDGNPAAGGGGVECRGYQIVIFNQYLTLTQT